MKRLLVALGVTSLLFCGSAQAAYPEKDITIIVPYGAGGGSDIMVRTVAPYIEKYLGNDAHVIVENRTGASGIVGWKALHDAKPDGYTIGIITTPSIVTKPIEGKADFTWKDFTIIANMVNDPAALNVKKDSKFKTVKDLIDFAKANPKVVTMATGNFGGDDHLAGLQLSQLTGAEFTFIPFPGAAARNATMGGHVTVGSFNLGEAVNYQDSVNILGIMSDKRVGLAPNIPTLKEQGIDLVMSSQRGFAGPKGMPEVATKALEAALVKALNDPKFQAEAKNQGLVLQFSSSSEFSKSLEKFDENMKKTWATSPWLK